MRWLPVARLVVLTGLGCVVGCGSGEGRLAVSGTVQLKGKPLDRGTIEFQPQDPGGTFEGAGIENGKYQVPATQGLLPGKYKVVITSPHATLKEEAAPGESGPPAKDRIPPQYNSASKEFVEVKRNSPNVFDYDIK